jgi:hypothetical protein
LEPKLPLAQPEDRRAVAGAGLCQSCAALQVLRSKTSTFVRCARSDHDAAFPRYPPLPVRTCPGYRPAGDPAAPDTAWSGI